MDAGCGCSWAGSAPVYAGPSGGCSGRHRRGRRSVLAQALVPVEDGVGGGVGRHQQRCPQQKSNEDGEAQDREQADGDGRQMLHVARANSHGDGDDEESHRVENQNRRIADGVNDQQRKEDSPFSSVGEHAAAPDGLAGGQVLMHAGGKGE